MRSNRLRMNVARCLALLGFGCALAATGSAWAQTPVYYETQTLSERGMDFDNSEFGAWLGANGNRLTVGMVGASLKYDQYRWIGGLWYYLGIGPQYTVVAGAADATIGMGATVAALYAGEQAPGEDWVTILHSNGQWWWVFPLNGPPSALAVSYPTLVLGVGDWNSAAGWVSFKVYNDVTGWETGSMALFGYAPPGSNFGAALAMDDRVLVVGAPHVTSGGAGEVYVFLWDPQDVACPQDWCLWNQLSIGEAGDRFGAAVALDGDWIAVGAPFDDDTMGFSDRGRVYLYRRSGAGAWVWQATLAGSQGGAQFGTSVAMVAGSLLVGAPGEDIGAGQLVIPDVGAAYLYRRGGDHFSAVGKLISNFVQAGMRRGTAVGLNGYSAVVGAPFADLESDAYDTGAVFAYSIVPFFFDGFESGDTYEWSAVVP